MKKKFMLVLVLSWMGSMAMAQEADKKLLSSPELQKITVLKDLAGQIAQEQAILVSTSRSGAAAAQEKLNTLYASYEKELQHQEGLHADDAATLAAISQELKLVATKK